MKVTVNFDSDGFKRKANEAAAKALRNSLTSVRCPEHRRTVELPPGSGMPEKFGVCCEKLRDAVEHAMKGKGER